MARGALKCRGYIIFKDGRCIPVEEMTEDERERVSKSMNERLSMVMSEYYTAHPEKF